MYIIIYGYSVLVEDKVAIPNENSLLSFIKVSFWYIDSTRITQMPINKSRLRITVMIVNLYFICY